MADAKTIKPRGIFKSTEALKANTQKQSEKWNNSNVTLNQMSPCMATVYAVNLEASTVYKGTEDVKDIIGKESPIRFDKVYDYRILVDSEIFGPDTKEEYGFQIDSTLNVNIVPGSVNLEDLSIITLQSMPGIYFKINNSNLSKVLPNAYSQSMLSVMFTSADPDRVASLERQVVNEWTMTKYSQGMYVLNNKVIDKKNALMDIEEDVLETFIALYWNKDIQSVAYKKDDVLTYDPYFIKFLQRNKVLQARDMKIFKLCNSSEVMEDEDFDLFYRRSIFGKLEKKKKILGGKADFYMYSYNTYAEYMKWSRFWELKLDYSRIWIISYMKRPKTESITFTPTSLNDKNDSTLDNIIHAYLNKDIDEIPTELFNCLYDYYDERSYENMIKLGLCIHILHEKVKSLHGKNMDSNIVEEVI